MKKFLMITMLMSSIISGTFIIGKDIYKSEINNISANHNCTSVTKTSASVNVADTPVSYSWDELIAGVHFDGWNGSGSYTDDNLDGIAYTRSGGTGVNNNLSNGDTLVFSLAMEAGYSWDGSVEGHPFTLPTAIGLLVEGLDGLVSYSQAEIMSAVEFHDSTYTIHHLTGIDITPNPGPIAPNDLVNGDVTSFNVELADDYTWDSSQGYAQPPSTMDITVTGLKADPGDTNAKIHYSDIRLQDAISFVGDNNSGQYFIAPMQGIQLNYASGGTNGSLSNREKITFSVVLESGYEWDSTISPNPGAITVSVTGLSNEVGYTEAYLQDRINFTGERNGEGRSEISQLRGISISWDNSNNPVDNGDLKNGDYAHYIVKSLANYSWDINMAPVDTFTKEVEGLDRKISYTVPDLQAAISFSGITGSGTIIINNPLGITLAIESGGTSGSLSNGDELTLSVTLDSTHFDWDSSGPEQPDTITVRVDGLPNSSPTPSGEGNKLSAGAIAGILIGSIAGLILIGSISYFGYKKYNKHPKKT